MYRDPLDRRRCKTVDVVKTLTTVSRLLAAQPPGTMKFQVHLKALIVNIQQEGGCLNLKLLLGCLFRYIPQSAYGR